jgi:hypothetical protein
MTSYRRKDRNRNEIPGHKFRIQNLVRVTREMIETVSPNKKNDM